MRIGGDVPRRSGGYPLDWARDAVREMQDAPLGIDASGFGVAVSLLSAEIPRLRAEFRVR